MDFEKGDLKKIFVKMAVPTSIAMTVNALYNMVDTIFVGNGVGVEALGGLAIAFPIQMLIIAISAMVGFGASSLISISLGKKQQESANKAVGNALMLSGLLGILTSIIVSVFLEQILRGVGASDITLPYAAEYLRIILLGNIFVFISVTGFNIIRADGSAKYAMILMCIGAVVNTILDPIFIFHFGWGVQGAAAATVISRVVSTALIIRYFAKSKVFSYRWQYFKLQMDIVQKIISVGSATFFSQISFSIVAVIMNLSLLKYGGDIYVSVYSIINRVLLLVLMPLLGIAQGFQPIAGYNYGAGNIQRVKKIMKIAVISAISLCSVFFILFVFSPRSILSLFCDDLQLINAGENPLKIACLILPLIGIQTIAFTLFQAVGLSKKTIFISLSRQFLFFIPLVIVFPLFFGVMGIWYAYPVADLLSVAVSLILIKDFFDTEELELRKA